MDLTSIPGLNLLPAKYQGPILAFVGLMGVIVPQLGRAYHAISSGGGLKGVMSGLWLGTNTPKDAPAAPLTGPNPTPILK